LRTLPAVFVPQDATREDAPKINKKGDIRFPRINSERVAQRGVAERAKISDWELGYRETGLRMRSAPNAGAWAQR